jgi:transcriptional regulator with XRE-family HTH domain
LLINTSQSWLEFMHDLRGGMSERETADWLGVSQATVHRWLTDPRTPHETTLKKVADATGIPLPKLRELAERPPGKAYPFRLPDEANQLTGPQRDLIRGMVSMLLDSGKPAKVTR